MTRTTPAVRLSLIAIFIISTAVPAFLVWRHRKPLSLASTSPLRLEWEPETRYRYHVDLSYLEKIRLIPNAAALQSVDVESGLRGDLVVDVHGKTAQGVLLELQFEHVENPRFEIQGTHVFDDDRAAAHALEGKSLVARIDARGEFRDVFERASVTTRADSRGPVFARTMRLLVREMALTLRDGSSWTADEETVLGNAAIGYLRDADAGGTQRVHRRRVRYSSFRGFDALAKGLAAPTIRGETIAEIALHDGLRALVEHEQTSVSDQAGGNVICADMNVELHFTSKESSPLPSPDLTSPDWVVEESTFEHADEEVALTKRVGGLTLDDVLRIIDAAAAGSDPSGTSWIWQATGLLEQFPAYCALLASAAIDPAEKSRARGMILDLLASTRRPEAQAAMRSILLDSEVMRDATYPMLVQRFLFVGAPDQATLAFLQQLYARPSVSRAQVRGALNALGSCAGARAALVGAEGDAARTQLASLRDELARAQTTEQKDALLMALGNAGHASNVPAVVRLARDASPRVRRDVADALARTPIPAAKETLHELTHDTEGQVAAAALDALEKQEIPSSEVRDLARDVARIPAAADTSLLKLLVSRGDRGDDVEQALEAIASRHPDDAKLQAIARTQLRDHGRSSAR